VYNTTDPTLDNLDRGDFQCNDHGHLKNAVRRSATTLLVDDVTYNNIILTTTSSSVDARDFRTGFLYYELTESGTATDIQLQLQGSFDDSTFVDLGESFHQELLFDDITINAGVDEYITVPNLPPFIRLVVTATDTTAVNTFTLTANWSMMD